MIFEAWCQLYLDFFSLFLEEPLIFSENYPHVVEGLSSQPSRLMALAIGPYVLQVQLTNQQPHAYVVVLHFFYLIN